MNASTNVRTEHRMPTSCCLLAFFLDDQQFGLHLPAVQRVVRAVEITPLPKGPEIVLGVMNVQGRIIPVVNVRKRFRLPEEEMNLNDQLIIADTSKRTVALLVNEVGGVLEYPAQEVTTADKIVPGLEYVEGVVKLEDGMILIHNLDTFLSLEEEKVLEEALRIDD